MSRRLTSSGIAAAVLILTATIVLSYREWREYQRQSAAVTRSRQVLESVNDILARLLEAENAQRAFLLTGDEQRLEAYRAANAGLPAPLARLERLEPSPDVSRLRDLINRKLGEFNRGIQERRAQPPSPGAVLIGEQTMAEIREVWSAIRGREYVALTADPHPGEAIAHMALLIAVGISLILLFFAVGSPRTFEALKETKGLGLAGYVLALAATLGATLLRIALIPFLGETAVPFITYFPAILLVSWRRGFRAGAATLALSLVAADYLFLSASHTLSPPSPGDEVALFTFAVVGLGIAWLAHSQRQAVQVAAAENALRREAEAAQSAQRQQLEITINSIGDAVIATDAAGRIALVNEVAQRLLRGDGSQILGRPMHEVFRIVNESTRRHVDNPVAKVLREGVVVGLANHTVLIGLDGTETPIDDSAAPIRNDAGEIVGAVLVFRDITDRRASERAAAFLEALVASSDDAIVGKSLDGIVQTWNAGAERLYGYRAEEIVGHPALELIPPDRAHEESDILERLRAGERVSHMETVRQRKDGSLVDVSLTLSPVRNQGGEVVGVSHVARDITEQKRAAESILQTQKLESLGVLAGGIAHDFNNLLVGILGNASLALDELPADTPAREKIEDVILAGERAAQLTRQMLAYSGKGRFVLERIDLSAEVRDTLPLLQAAIPRTVELRLELAPDLPLVEVDPAQVHQIFMNLVVNGAEAIPEGRTGTVEVATRRVTIGDGDPALSQMMAGGELRAGEYVLLEVRDSGAGMDASTRERIFDPFFTTKFTGRGLGLAAVLGIVRGHGGSIAVSSEPGRGATFRVWLPSRVLDEKREQPAGGPPLDLAGAGTVLVIDDDDTVRRVAKTTLERHGYTVLAAANGAEGVELFRRHDGEVCCVVLDLTMPVMSGEEALHRIAAIRSGVPVILSSGYSEAEALRRFGGQGLAGFLQKPYHAATLAAKVRQALGAAEPTA